MSIACRTVLTRHDCVRCNNCRGQTSILRSILRSDLPCDCRNFGLSKIEKNRSVKRNTTFSSNLHRGKSIDTSHKSGRLAANGRQCQSNSMSSFTRTLLKPGSYIVLFKVQLVARYVEFPARARALNHSEAILLVFSQSFLPIDAAIRSHLLGSATRPR